MKGLSKINFQKKISALIPKKIKNILRFFGLTDFFYNHFLDKYESELAAKMGWGKEFEKENVKINALNYYRKFRFLDDLLIQTHLSNESVVLDVGCGIASILHFIPGKKKIGIDPLADWYHKFYSYPKDLDVRKSHGEKIDFEDGYFTHIFCTNVLDHVSKPIEVLSEIKRVLVPGGYFILTVETHEKSGKSRGPHHPHTFSKKDVRELIRLVGFNVVTEKETSFLGVQQYSLGMPTKKDKESFFILRS